MKLTKYQKARLLEFNWDVIEVNVQEDIQNCAWIKIEPEDGEVYQQAIEHLDIKNNKKPVKLLVVAYNQD